MHSRARESVVTAVSMRSLFQSTSRVCDVHDAQADFAPSRSLETLLISTCSFH